MIDDVLGVSVELALWGGLLILILGLAKLLYVPLAVAFEVREAIRKRRGHPTLADDRPMVSVIVPAYNEAATLENCVRSVLAGGYEDLEVVVVDDGSTDATPDIMRALAAADGRVRTLFQANAGKGVALNRGIAASIGEIVFCVDADGMFTAQTIEEMLRGFDHPAVGAVCGDDRPVNLNRPTTHLLALVSYVGTGLVRRALVMFGCLPIVSGNIGAFRRDVIARLLFREDTVGEDLELTWRVHKAGYRVNFRPLSLVYAEVPATVRGLWRQRVRWGRGLLQTLGAHLRMVGNPRYGVFGVYLAYNAVTMVVLPVVQLLALAVVPIVAVDGGSPVGDDVLAIGGWLGIWLSLGLMLISLALGRGWRDTRLLWAIVLWPLYSVLMSVVVVASIAYELRGGPAPWNKLDRTGVVSRQA
ncbi:MAG: glycosyltransferase [Streptosporangiales bacterium]